MKKIFLIALCAGSVGFLAGCEDKEAEVQQNQKIEMLSSEINRLNGEIDRLKSENTELKRKYNLVGDWIKKKIQSEKPSVPVGTKKNSTTKKTTP